MSQRAAWMTSCTASSIVMKYRLTSGWVTVIGPPAFICARKVVKTDPRLPSTLPNRTLRYVPLVPSAALIRDLNELDLKLYEYVQSEFLNPKIEQLGSVLRRDIRAFDIANRVAAPLSGAFALRSALRRRVQRLKRPT